MADKTISALTSATTPLAGTEVLPIVQGGTTVKVAVSDLTAARAVATAALSATGIILTTDATDASSTTAASLKTAGGLAVVKKTYIGDNIVPSAAKGINYTANTPAAGMTSQLLNWYEEGTWTPVITFLNPGDLSVTYTSIRLGTYTRIGNRVYINFNINTSAFTFTTANGSLLVTGLPFTAQSSAGNQSFGSLIFTGITKVGYTSFVCNVVQGSAQISFVASASALASSTVIGTDVPSGGAVSLRGSVTYQV